MEDLALMAAVHFLVRTPRKLTRSGAYMARYIAKHIVFSRLAEMCQVAISYAIGKAEPVAVQIDTFGTGKVSDDVLAKAVNDIFDMRPAAIINKFSLKTCSFADYSAYGHFGNGYPAWEHMEQYEELREAVKNMKTTTEMQLVPIQKLVPYINNARTHSPEQIGKLRASLREFGFINPVIIDRDYGVIAGHGRILAAKEEGIKEYRVFHQ